MLTNFNKFLLVVLVLAAFGLLHLLAPILMPFLAAALIAYLIDPFVERMTQRWRFPRILSVVIVFILLFFILSMLVLLIIPVIQKQIIALLAAIPGSIEWFQTVALPWLDVTFGFDPVVNAETIKATIAEHGAAASNAITWVLRKVLQSGRTLIEWTTNLILIPVVTFYLLRDWRKILDNIRSLLPRNVEPTIVKLTKQCDEVLSEFFRGQLLVMLSLGVIYSVGLSIVGLKVGLLIGLLIGLMSIVPFLGFILGIVIASIAAYIQFGGFSSVGLVWLVFAIAQTLESVVLTPRLVGHRIGLHPVAVIFAVMAGGSLFGFFGVLLALPVAAVIMVWLRFFKHSYQHSRLYK